VEDAPELSFQPAKVLAGMEVARDADVLVEEKNAATSVAIVVISPVTVVVVEGPVAGN
jgi:hypothetical protein